jgi:hypothetical protein
MGMLQARQDLVACTCQYERRDEFGALVLNRGMQARRGSITLVFRRELVVSTLGFFDSVRTSADEEFRERLRLVFGQNAMAHISKPLYQARARLGTLTTAGSAPINLSTSHPVDFLSPNRRQYVDSYRSWHSQISSSLESPFLPFPLTRRRFSAPLDLLPSLSSASPRPVYAAVASIPLRAAHLQAVVKAILPQVDRLYIFLNGYESVPPFLQDNPTVHVVQSLSVGDFRDNGKFYFLRDPPTDAFYFTLDDDIAYPPDYVRTLLLKIEQYQRRAVVGVHGVVFSDPLQSFFSNRRVLQFDKELQADQSVNLLGTGTVAFHRGAINLSFEYFGQPGMPDLWLAISQAYMAMASHSRKATECAAALLSPT